MCNPRLRIVKENFSGTSERRGSPACRGVCSWRPYALETWEVGNLHPPAPGPRILRLGGAALSLRLMRSTYARTSRGVSLTGTPARRKSSPYLWASGWSYPLRRPRIVEACSGELVPSLPSPCTSPLWDRRAGAVAQSRGARVDTLPHPQGVYHASQSGRRMFLWWFRPAPGFITALPRPGTYPRCDRDRRGRGTIRLDTEGTAADLEADEFLDGG